jgi:hypothetical protein
MSIRLLCPRRLLLLYKLLLTAQITDRDASALKYLPSSKPKPVFKLIFEFSSDDHLSARDSRRPMTG